MRSSWIPTFLASPFSRWFFSVATGRPCFMENPSDSSLLSRSSSLSGVLDPLRLFPVLSRF